MAADHFLILTSEYNLWDNKKQRKTQKSIFAIVWFQTRWPLCSFRRLFYTFILFN